jgi:hypothetical protein
MPEIAADTVQTINQHGLHYRAPVDVREFEHEGILGKAQLNVPREATITIDSELKLHFPIGTYFVPMRLKTFRPLMRVDKETGQQVVDTVPHIDVIAGNSDSELHWYLRDRGTKHTGYIEGPGQTIAPLGSSFQPKAESPDLLTVVQQQAELLKQQSEQMQRQNEQIERLLAAVQGGMPTGSPKDPPLPFTPETPATAEIRGALDTMKATIAERQPRQIAPRGVGVKPAVSQVTKRPPAPAPLQTPQKRAHGIPESLTLSAPAPRKPRQVMTRAKR